MAVFREEQIEKRGETSRHRRVIYIGISALRIANNQSSLFSPPLPPRSLNQPSRIFPA